MPKMAFKTKATRRLIPEGTYVATFNAFQEKVKKSVTEAGTLVPVTDEDGDPIVESWGFQFLIENQGSAWKWFNFDAARQFEEDGDETKLAAFESAMRATLAAIGQRVSDEEGEVDFDPSDLIGQRLSLTIKHRKEGGKVYDNVVATRPLRGEDGDEDEEGDEG